MKKSVLHIAAATASLGAMSASEAQKGRYMRDIGGHKNSPLIVKDDDGNTIPALSAKEQSLVDSIKESLAKQIEKATDNCKEIAENATDARFNKLTENQKADADANLSKLNELSAKFDELEQSIAERPGDAEIAKSIGYQFADGDALKTLKDNNGGRGRASMDFKANITSATGTAAGNAGAGLDNARLPGILPIGQRSFFIQDMLASGRMSGNSIEYVKEAGFNNNAAPVAEGVKKPQSDFKLELVTAGAKVIAHTMKASRQILDDIDMLAATIDQRLTYGARYSLENQILNGDGTGQNLNGLMVNATALALPVGADAPEGEFIAIENLRVAMLQAVLADFPATGHILNPIDWYNIETAKDGDNRYIIGNPSSNNDMPKLWNLPVAVSQFMSAGTFLTGSFAMAAQYFTRWDARVEVATENEDDFVKNMVTMLCEQRGALAVYRGEALITGSTSVAAAA